MCGWQILVYIRGTASLTRMQNDFCSQQWSRHAYIPCISLLLLTGGIAVQNPVYLQVSILQLTEHMTHISPVWLEIQAGRQLANYVNASSLCQCRQLWLLLCTGTHGRIYNCVLGSTLYKQQFCSILCQNDRWLSDITSVYMSAEFYDRPSTGFLSRYIREWLPPTCL